MNIELKELEIPSCPCCGHEFDEIEFTDEEGVVKCKECYKRFNYACIKDKKQKMNDIDQEIKELETLLEEKKKIKKQQGKTEKKYGLLTYRQFLFCHPWELYFFNHYFPDYEEYSPELFDKCVSYCDRLYEVEKDAISKAYSGPCAGEIEAMSAYSHRYKVLEILKLIYPLIDEECGKHIKRNLEPYRLQQVLDGISAFRINRGQTDTYCEYEMKH